MSEEDISVNLPEAINPLCSEPPDVHSESDVQEEQNSRTDFSSLATNESMKQLSDRIFLELRDIHKVCQNFIAGSLVKAEEELDTYHSIERGCAFDDVLRNIASIYIDYEDLPEIVGNEKARKRINYMLMDILQVLESYGVEIQKSTQGEERKLRLTQTAEYIETDDPELYGKIARSKRSGFRREKDALIKELVAVYIKKEERTSC